MPLAHDRTSDADPASHRSCAPCRRSRRARLRFRIGVRCRHSFPTHQPQKVHVSWTACGSAGSARRSIRCWRCSPAIDWCGPPAGAAIPGRTPGATGTWRRGARTAALTILQFSCGTDTSRLCWRINAPPAPSGPLAVTGTHGGSDPRSSSKYRDSLPGPSHSRRGGARNACTQPIADRFSSRSPAGTAGSAGPTPSTLKGCGQPLRHRRDRDHTGRSSYRGYVERSIKERR